MLTKLEKDKLIREEGFITRCPSNISKMNILEYIWYRSEMYTLFGKRRKPNIFIVLLFLICPWFEDIRYELSRGILNLTVIEFITLMVIMFLTLFFMGPLFAVVSSYLIVKNAKK